MRAGLEPEVWSMLMSWWWSASLRRGLVAFHGRGRRPPRPLRRLGLPVSRPRPDGWTSSRSQLAMAGDTSMTVFERAADGPVDRALEAGQVDHRAAEAVESTILGESSRS